MTTSPFSPFQQAPSPLLGYGFDARVGAALAALHPSPGSEPARVLRAERTSCEAMTASGPVRVPLVASAQAGGEGWPVTGDWIVLAPIDPTDAPGHRRLESLMPRHTQLRRGGVGPTARVQLLAANVDTVVVTVPMTQEARPARTERLLALAWSSGAVPLLALTKADACPDPAGALREHREVALGVELIATSAASGEGIDELRGLATGTIALIGPSGAGKSSLGNALLGADLLATGAVRESDGRGRHTTAWRELLPLPGGGVLLDTPGLRTVGMSGDGEGLERTFGDVEELAAACRFANCEHRTEPGCAVLAAVEEGALSERRLASYRKLLRENAWQASRSDALLRQRLGAERKSMARSHRAMKRKIKRRDTGR